jgi:hypothetical protein
MGGIVQKRKFQKGWHIDLPHRHSLAQHPSSIKIPSMPMRLARVTDGGSLNVQKAPEKDTLKSLPDSSRYQRALAKLPDSLQADYANLLKHKRLMAVAALGAFSTGVLLLVTAQAESADRYFEAVSALQLFTATFGVMAWRTHRDIKHPKAFAKQGVLKKDSNETSKPDNSLKILGYIGLGLLGLILFPILLSIILNALFTGGI